ncbi:cytochrome P450 [Streptomyces phaeochromogenes]
MTTPPPRLPFDQPHPLTMPPQLRELQMDGPIHKIHTEVGDDAWLVTGYPQVRELLDDSRLGRSHPDPANAPRVGQSALLGAVMSNYATEHEDHAYIRRVAQPLFSPKRMRAMRPRVEELTANLLDDLAKSEQPADLLQALALPLPILVICELLGVSYDDRGRFRAWVLAAADAQDRERSRKGLTTLYAYSQELVALRRRRPGQDVVSSLCAVDGLADDKIATLTMALLFGGHETTVVSLGLGALLLLAHPEQGKAMRDDPDLIPGAVEEILRMPVKNRGGLVRYAREEIEYAGVTIRPGELVLLDNRGANHDTGVYPEADRFDVTRRDAPHLTFGHGPRYCMGAPLARVELQVAFEQLVHRFPTMRLARPYEELMGRANLVTGGLAELPVMW